MRLARVNASSEGGVSACLFNLTPPTLGHALHEMDKWIFTCTVGPHYLIILDSWICKLAKISWHPQNQHLWQFATICEHVQSGENKICCQTCTFPAEVTKDDTRPSCSSSHTANQCLSCGLVHARFHILVLLSVILMFQMALKCSAEQVPFAENTSVWQDSSRREVTALLALSSGLVNQQYVLSNVSLNKNKHKTK